MLSQKKPQDRSTSSNAEPRAYLRVGSGTHIRASSAYQVHGQSGHNLTRDLSQSVLPYRHTMPGPRTNMQQHEPRIGKASKQACKTRIEPNPLTSSTSSRNKERTCEQASSVSKTQLATASQPSVSMDVCTYMVTMDDHALAWAGGVVACWCKMST
jgi:hypothetical protein